MMKAKLEKNYEQKLSSTNIFKNNSLGFQIIFDSFTVGRFDEGMVDIDVDGYETSLSPNGELPGCPEGFMQVSALCQHPSS